MEHSVITSVLKSKGKTYTSIVILFNLTEYYNKYAHSTKQFFFKFILLRRIRFYKKENKIDYEKISFPIPIGSHYP